uniref:hypothetical protein n=1 Tax=Mycobacterium tilburgii TaxID=44467 RepID=UPI0038994AD5
MAACELVDRGLRILVLDQENSANLGAGRPSGRSAACSSWTAPSSVGRASGTATSSPCRTGWALRHSIAKRTTGRQWTQAYVDFAAGEKRSWLRERG